MPANSHAVHVSSSRPRSTKVILWTRLETYFPHDFKA